MQPTPTPAIRPWLAWSITSAKRLTTPRRSRKDMPEQQGIVSG
jgi:hypothetical protein